MDDAGGGKTAKLRWVRWLTLGVVGLAVLRVGWVGDDALITLRHALNITHGWGPGFNATESVQAYTHPLWFLMWSGLGWVTGEWIVTMVALSVACTVGAVALVVRRAHSTALVVAAAAVFVFSNAFTEFAVSGLENPLSYLWVGVVLTLTLRSVRWGDGLWGDDEVWAQRSTVWWAVALGVAVAAVGLTRLDLLVVVGPPAAVWAWKQRRNLRALVAAAAGFAVPFAAWHAWAYSTYGSLLPNTYAAKRNTNIPVVELVGQGLRYVWVSASADPVTFATIVVGLTVGFWWGSALVRGACAGVVGYVGYVVWIGGDFMVGRFFAVPLYVSVFVAVAVVSGGRFGADDGWFGVRAKHPTRVVSLGVLVVLGVLLVVGSVPTTVVPVDGPRRGFFGDGISDEWGQYRQSRVVNVFQPPVGESLSAVREAANGWPVNAGGRVVVPDAVETTWHFCGSPGLQGLFGGPRVHVVDRCGLTDRFIASKAFIPETLDGGWRHGIVLRVEDGEEVSLREGLLGGWFGGNGWRVAHLDRELPEGYLDAVAGGDPSRVRDPALAAELAELWSVIR